MLIEISAIEPRIVVPNTEQAADLLRLRSDVFSEELALGGISSAAIQRHIGPWNTNPSVAGYQERMTEWLADEVTYYRAVMVGEAVAGLYLAKRGTEETERNQIRVIQLAQNLRGKGVGRALMTEFEVFANPNMPTTLEVVRDNTPARGFYEHLGFRRTGMARSLPIATETLTLITMQKDARVSLNSSLR